MSSAPRVAIVYGDGAYQLPVVGEAAYQGHLQGIAGKKTKTGVRHYCSAAILPEPNNAYDRNAIRVDVEGWTVGYLDRHTAPDFGNCLSVNGFSAAVCAAVIVGGWDNGNGDVGNFGIKLDAIRPFQLFTSDSQTEEPQKISPKAAAVLNQEDVGVPKKKERAWLLLIAVLAILYFVFSGPSEKATKVVDVLKAQFGAVCDPKIEGSDTLRIDFTASTKRLDFITIMASVGGAKTTIYGTGIRYFKFPNSSGTYNIIDWKTGEKTSVSERARYYFPD